MVVNNESLNYVEGIHRAPVWYCSTFAWRAVEKPKTVRIRGVLAEDYVLHYLKRCCLS
jgi:hypothetical protein